MIYHIPAGTAIRRMKSPTSDSVLVDTSKEVWYTDKDLVKIEPENGTSGWAKNASHGPVYIFLLPLSAKPWWSFRVYEDAIHHIHFIGTTTSGARNEQELLQDLKSGKINPFKTTPESTANNGTAEERIVGRVLTPRERAEIKEQWDNDDNSLKSYCDEMLKIPFKVKYKKLNTVQTTGFIPPYEPRITSGRLTRLKPKDSAEAIAWAIDREIMKELTHGLWNLGPIPLSGQMFYMDFKFGGKK